MDLSHWNIFTGDEDKATQQAVLFLCEHYTASNTNTKPVLIHSLRVASLLDLYNADYRTVIAGILHDLLEDTACTAEQITEAFGDEVTSLVEACSFDPQIDDYVENYKEHFARIADDKEALLIKTADIIDNRRYINLGNPDKLNLKHKHFIEIAEPVLKDDTLFIQLVDFVSKG